MTISIDFDRTWTADPQLWRKFYYDAKERGHRVVIATNRSEWAEDMKRHAIPDDLSIYFCGQSLKSDYMRKMGVNVDIWIDDMPGTVRSGIVIGGVNDSQL